MTDATLLALALVGWTIAALAVVYGVTQRRLMNMWREKAAKERKRFLEVNEECHIWSRRCVAAERKLES